MPKSASPSAWPFTSSATWSASRPTPRSPIPSISSNAPANVPPLASSTPFSARWIAIPSPGPPAKSSSPVPNGCWLAWDATSAPSIARAALQEPEKYTRAGRTQDIGSQSIVPLLQLAPGQSFLDLCAAPGNKTAQALESGVRVTACDLHLHRIAQLKNLTPNLLVLDGTQPLPFARPFHRILLAAPCSGTDTPGRNPEIKCRLTPADLDDLHRRQAALLERAMGVLALGGILVYSTCSLEPEENESIVSAVPPNQIVETLRRLPGRDPGDGFFAAVVKPHS